MKFSKEHKLINAILKNKNVKALNILEDIIKCKSKNKIANVLKNEKNK